MAYYYNEQGKKIELKDIIEGFNFLNDGKCKCGICTVLLIILLIILLLACCGVGYCIYKNKK
jgi:hypothetical protein